MGLVASPYWPFTMGLEMLISLAAMLFSNTAFPCRRTQAYSGLDTEISVSSPEYAWVRLHGKAVFENNMAAKEMSISNPIVKGQYGEATNPIFEVFYLEDAHGAIADFSGNPPYEF